MKLTSRQSSRRCAFCHDALVGETQTCSCCRTEYHRDCLQDELRGRCGTPGCAAPSSTLETPVGPLVCCSDTILEADHYQCGACGRIYHEACLRRTGPCCGDEFRRVRAVRAPPVEHYERRFFVKMDVPKAFVGFALTTLLPTLFLTAALWKKRPGAALMIFTLGSMAAAILFGLAAVTVRKRR